MLVMTLTWRTGDGGAALVLGLLHHAVLTNWLDKWTHPRKQSLKEFLQQNCKYLEELPQKTHEHLVMTCTI